MLLIERLVIGYASAKVRDEQIYSVPIKCLQEICSDWAFNQTTRNRVRERAQKCEMDKFIQSTSNACKKFVQIGLLIERLVIGYANERKSARWTNLFKHFFFSLALLLAPPLWSAVFSQSSPRAEQRLFPHRSRFSCSPQSACETVSRAEVPLSHHP